MRALFFFFQFSERGKGDLPPVPAPLVVKGSINGKFKAHTMRTCLQKPQGRGSKANRLVFLHFV